MNNPYGVPDVVKIKIDAVGDDYADYKGIVDYSIKAGEIGTVIDVLNDTHVMLEFECKEDLKITVVDIKDIELVEKYSKD